MTRKEEIIRIVRDSSLNLIDFDKAADKIIAMFPIKKPTMEEFGFQNSTSFEQEVGWMIEGGEEEYYKALKKYKEQNG